MPRLTDARMSDLRAKKITRNVRDTALTGFGVRVLPSGRKQFSLHSQHEGQRIWRIVDDPAEMTVAKARARGLLAARAVHDALPRSSLWVFPAVRGEGPLSKTTLTAFWFRVWAEAGLKNVRLHDLRHSYESQCVIAGVPLPIVSKLLGHSQCEMTLRYAHTADRYVEAAAECIGARIVELLQCE